MCHTAPAQDYRLPEFQISYLRAELVTVDNMAVQALDALDPRVIEGFSVHRTPGAADIHVSVLVAADATQAEAMAATLAGQRHLVFVLLLTKTARGAFSGSYLVCPPDPQNLSALLAALRRLCFEHSLIAIDFADFAPIFRGPGQIRFVHRVLPQGSSLAQAGAELGQHILTQGEPLSRMAIVLACGADFVDPTMNEPGFLSQVDLAANAIIAPLPDNSVDWTVLTGYMLGGLDVFSIGVFFAP